MCSCCHTSTSGHEPQRGIDLMRRQWIANGMRWESKLKPEPPDLNPVRQLKQLLHEEPQQGVGPGLDPMAFLQRS